PPSPGLKIAPLAPVPNTGGPSSAGGASGLSDEQAAERAAVVAKARGWRLGIGSLAAERQIRKGATVLRGVRREKGSRVWGALAALFAPGEHLFRFGTAVRHAEIHRERMCAA